MTSEPDVIDVVVGKNLRTYRKMAGMTQKSLADELGITFQQLQKYEKGTNRVSASRMYRIALALKIKIPQLYEGVGEEGSSQGELMQNLESDSIELLRYFQAIKDKSTRKSVVNIVKLLDKKAA